MECEIYDYSGNYDCPFCGRVNCAFGVIFYYPDNNYERHCSECVEEYTSDSELAAYRKAQSTPTK